MRAADSHTAEAPPEAIDLQPLPSEEKELAAPAEASSDAQAEAKPAQGEAPLLDFEPSDVADAGASPEAETVDAPQHAGAIGASSEGVGAGEVQSSSAPLLDLDSEAHHTEAASDHAEPASLPGEDSALSASEAQRNEEEEEAPAEHAVGASEHPAAAIAQDIERPETPQVVRDVRSSSDAGTSEILEKRELQVVHLSQEYGKLQEENERLIAKIQMLVTQLQAMHAREQVSWMDVVL